MEVEIELPCKYCNLVLENLETGFAVLAADLSSSLRIEDWSSQSFNFNILDPAQTEPYHITGNPYKTRPHALHSTKTSWQVHTAIRGKPLPPSAQHLPNQ